MSDSPETVLDDSVTFTTGEAAKMLGVSQQMVIRWVDADEFSGAYKVPGSTHRRIPGRSVKEMLARFGLDAPVSERVFTTGEVAEIMRLSQQTIIRFIDQGLLKGHRVSGNPSTKKGYRKIRESDLRSFMEAKGLPLEPLETFTKE